MPKPDEEICLDPRAVTYATIMAMFEKVERLHIMRCRQQALLLELVSSLAHHKLVIQNPDPADPALIRFNRKSLAVLRRVFRVVANPEAPRRHLSETREDMRTALITQYQLKIDERGFSFELPNRRGNKTVPVSLTLPAARALIRYLVPRLHPGEAAYRMHYAHHWEENPELNSWEQMPTEDPQAKKA